MKKLYKIVNFGVHNDLMPKEYEKYIEN